MDLLTPTLPLLRALHISWLQYVALGFSGLGTEECYLILFPLVYWLWNRRIGAGLGIILLVSVMVNDLVKLAFHLPRPFWVDPSLARAVLPLAQEWSFGFPSGHSQAAFLVWPYLALRATRKKLFLSLAFALATCIALSRLVLGVHWPLDVAGGILIGLAILWLYETYGKTVESKFRGSPLVAQMAMAVGFVLICASLGSWFIRHDIQPLDQMDSLKMRLQPSSASVTQNITAVAQASNTVVSQCSALLGLVVGLMFAPPNVPAGGTKLQLALRTLVGLIGVGVFYIGFKKIFPVSTPFIFARYFLTTFWVAGASLWVFRAVGLKGTSTAPLPVVSQPQ